MGRTSGDSIVRPASICRSAASCEHPTLNARSTTAPPTISHCCARESLAHSLHVRRRIVAVIEGMAFTAAAIQAANRSSVAATFMRRYEASARELRPNIAARVLNLLDGRHSFLDIAERAGIPFATFSADTEWWWVIRRT